MTSNCKQGFKKGKKHLGKYLQYCIMVNKWSICLIFKVFQVSKNETTT